MRANTLSEDGTLKRAIAKTLVFLGLGALISTINGAFLPTVRFMLLNVQSGSDVEEVFMQLLILNYMVDIVRSLLTLYTPVVTIALLRPVTLLQVLWVWQN